MIPWLVLSDIVHSLVGFGSHLENHCCRSERDVWGWRKKRKGKKREKKEKKRRKIMVFLVQIPINHSAVRIISFSLPPLTP